MKLWRKQGAIGKLHNLIRFIRTSPQREKLFMDLAETVSCTQDTLNEKTKNLHIIDDNKTDLSMESSHRIALDGIQSDCSVRCDY